MGLANNADPEAEPDLDTIVASYLEAVDAGQAPSREVFLAEHPQRAEEILQFFADHDAVTRWTKPFAPLSIGSTIGSGTHRDAMDAGESQAPPGSDPAKISASASARKGVIGDFELLELLGHGGMGVVYLARQSSLQRLVALKMLRTGFLATPAELQRLRNEAEAAAQLSHPHIVPIYEVGECDGQPYFSMRLMEGGHLGAQLDRYTTRPRAAVELMVTIARAVQHAHQRGVLHRDLKPSNILLDEAGHPHVSDFGLARRIDFASRLTASDSLVGTPSYMAPEQVDGGRSAVSTASDVYGLGAILYSLLTGRPPFQRPTPLETLAELKSTDPLPPSRINSAVDRDLEAVCLKCLEKEPLRRYQSAEDLAGDLECWLARKPVIARPITARARLARWARRNPLVASLAALVLLLLTLGTTGLVVGLVLLTRYGDELARQQTEVERQGKAARDNWTLAQTRQSLVESREAEVRRRLYPIEIVRAHRALGVSDVAMVRATLDQQLPQTGHEDLRGFEWHYLYRQIHSEVGTLVGHTGDVYDVAWSPGGERLVSGGNDDIARIWDVATGKCTATLTGHTADVNSLAFAPRGDVIATASDDGTVKVWDAETGQLRATLPGGPGVVSTVKFAPDGNRLVAATKLGLVKIWDVRSWRETHRWDAHTSDIHGLAISPDSRHMALASSDKTARLYEIPDGNPVRQFPCDHAVDAVDFSPDGSMLATGSRDPRVRLWDIASGAEIRQMPFEFDFIDSVVFSPRDPLLAATNCDGSVSVWRTTSPFDRANLCQGHHRRVWSAAWSKDGKRLATACEDRTVKLWNPHQPGASQTLTAGSVAVRCVAMSHDGRHVFAGDEAGSLWQWEVTSGRHHKTSTAHPEPIRWLDLSPDGRTLVSSAEDGYRMWDAERDTVQLREFIPRMGAQQALFSSSGQLAFTTHSSLQIAHLPSAAGTNQSASVDARTTRVRWLPDGRQLACIPDTGIGLRFWRPATGELEMAPTDHRRVITDMIVLKDNRTLITCSADHSVRSVNTVTGVRGAVLMHDSVVLAMALSADERTLAALLGDSTVQLWNLPTGQQLFPLRDFAGKAYEIAFSADGQTLAAAGISADGQGKVHIWQSIRLSKQTADSTDTDSPLSFLPSEQP